MLILTRRIGETLMVGDDVTVTVLGVKGNQVRIGVNAPKDVPVNREEIHNRIKAGIPKPASAKPSKKDISDSFGKHVTPHQAERLKQLLKAYPFGIFTQTEDQGAFVTGLVGTFQVTAFDRGELLEGKPLKDIAHLLIDAWPLSEVA